MPIGTDIDVADALATGTEHNPGGRSIINQVAVVLLARDAYSAGVDLRKPFQMRGAIVNRNATQ